MVEGAAEDLVTRAELLKSVRQRLFVVLLFATVVLVGLLAWVHMTAQNLPLLPLVLLSGVLGGFMGIQQRLATMSDCDLGALKSSWLSICFPSLFGCVFSILLYVLFMTGIIAGSIFPRFEVMPELTAQLKAGGGVLSIVNTKAASYQEVAKLVFWSFMAGYSERLVPQMVERIEERGKGTLA